MKLTLHKDKRIKQKRIFDALFQSGQSKLVYPIRFNWVESSKFTKQPVKVAFVVPKRLFKKAVVRNQLKRKMKEAYRLHQTELIQLCSKQKQSLAVLFIYQAKKKMAYKDIEKALQKTIQKLISIHELD